MSAFLPSLQARQAIPTESFFRRCNSTQSSLASNASLGVSPWPLMSDPLDTLRLAFGRADSQNQNDNAPTQAAVAAILRQGPTETELLFIQRSVRQGDPWSGHLAFPGGRIEEADASPRAAAERETSEEIGLALHEENFLGALEPLIGVRLPVSVSCFVYLIDGTPKWRNSSEVADTFWIPLSRLGHPDFQTTYELSKADQVESFPAIRLLDDDRPVLWGITYRFVQDLLTKMERQL